SFTRPLTAPSRAVGAPSPPRTVHPSLPSPTPATLAFAAGATQATATLNGGATQAQTTIQASSSNYTSTSTVATVKVVNVTFNPSSLSIAASLTADSTVVLSAAAPAGGLLMSLTVTDPRIASVSPASVVIPAGQLISPAFTVTGLIQGNTTMTASNPSVTTGPLNLF